MTMNGKRTINGLTVDEIKKYLFGIFSPFHLKKRKDELARVYFPKEVYFYRLNSVITESNYRYMVSLPVLQSVQQTNGYAAHVELKVFDDSGNVVHELCSNGIGYEPIQFNGNKAKSIDSPMKSAITKAKKNAIVELIGCNGHASNYDKNLSSERYEITTLDSFKEFSYFFIASGTINGFDEVFEFVIYKDVHCISKQTLRLLTSPEAANKTFAVKGLFCNIYGNQLHIFSTIGKE